MTGPARSERVMLRSPKRATNMGNFDLESGKRFMEEGDFVEGLRCFLASIDQDPGDPEAYVELFKAYHVAWEESGDPLVLDQMRKVALAGLKREPREDQRAFLKEGLDRTEEMIIAVQQAEEEAEHNSRKLPMFKDGP